MKQVAELFDPEPEQWGLRGDPWVWRALRDHLGESYLPPSIGEVEAMLYAAFNRLVAVDLATETTPAIYREEFAHGGMSSGQVHLETWRAVLIPMLLDRAGTML
jgi:hypothetical protein